MSTRAPIWHASKQRRTVLAVEVARRIRPSARGGWWDVPADDVPALLHKQEMVLPAYLAQRVRDAAERAGSIERRETRGPREIRVRFDPVVLRYPDGSTQTIYPRVDPFDGIIDHPIGGGF